MTDFVDSFFNAMPLGRMISGSKSGYMSRNPDNLVVFNANLCTKERGKIWFGDLDLSKDDKLLEQFAKALAQDLYVLREHDARFDNEESPKFENAVKVYRGKN